jgi:hypothetical protein
MPAGAFAALMIAVLLSLAIVPIRAAVRSGTFFASDVVLIAGPPIAFVGCLLLFNKPAQTGWALIGYPFLVLALSVVALWARVFLLPRTIASLQLVSYVFLAVAVTAAAIFGSAVPPWYE